MSKVKAFFSKAAEMFGFKKQTKYVAEYLHRANIRSGVFMAAVVAVLEMWLVIRQHQKYIIPSLQLANHDTYFKLLFDNTSLFWLLMVMGISMFLYCIAYLSEKRNKGFLIATFAVSAVGIVLCCLLPLESRIKKFNPKRLVDTVLLICLYASILIFHVSTIIAALTRYQGKKIDWLHSVLIITLFATCLLIFGIRVSYGDFTSTRTVDGTVIANPDYKQIICFLMMAIYVGCLLIWRPYISVAILGVIFLGFYFLLKSFDQSIRYFPDGDEVNYITFFISLAMVSVSIFNQRNVEAKKDQELEILATVDKLTGLMTYSYFLNECDRVILEKKDDLIDKYAFLFFNVTSFKIYNDQKGYIAGNLFLKNVGEIISKEFPNSFISRQADDHFVAYVPNIELIAKFDSIRDQVRSLDPDIKPNITIGYNIIIDDEHANVGVEKARYANSALKGVGRSDYFQYDKKMHDHFNLVQYIVSHVDEAVEKGWIKAYYQPVVYSKNGKLCGVEALARWIDPKYGFLIPRVFIEALEDAHLAYKVDLAMLELVCANMRKVLDAGGKIVPTSINFSRGDFSIINIPEEVIKITKKYGISPEFLHVEVTESALLEEKADLPQAMAELRKNGFAVWLDDFGRGYSSFNAIKDYAFDVVKLDMEFLKGFDKNEKSKPVIESVIKMSNSVHMGTLCEGVETKEQMEFLKKIGCERLQGYLFSKPIPYEELNKKIADGDLVI